HAPHRISHRDTKTQSLCVSVSPWLLSLLRGAWFLERPEELRQQERLEAVAADRDDLLLLRVQRHARGAREPDAWPLDDRARRDVAVVVRTVDGNEAHLVQTARIAVVVIVVLRLEFCTRLVEDVGFHLFHAGVLLREKNIAGGRVDRHLPEVRQLRIRSADELPGRDVAGGAPIEDEEADLVAIPLAARGHDDVADRVDVEADDVEEAGSF